MSKNRKAEVEAAQKTLDLKNKKYQLELDTSAGKIMLDMAADVAPGHVANCWGWRKLVTTTASFSIASSRAS